MRGALPLQDRLAALSPCPIHPYSPQQPRYGSSKISLLPNGVINQSFYRVVPTEHPLHCQRVKRGRKKSEDKGPRSKAEEQGSNICSAGWEQSPPRARRLREPAL